MSRQFCPSCGTEHPGQARFCMSCGAPLGAPHGPQPARVAGSAAPDTQIGTDWPSIIAAILAFLTLRGLSRQARGIAIIVIFFVLFFGCPVVCALAGLIGESLTHLFQ